MAWKVPRLKDVDQDSEPYALDVLAGVLDGNEAARFGRRLVREQKIAQSAGAGYEEVVRGEALFVVDGQPAEGHTVAELETALRGELRRVAEEGVSEEELARIKTQLVADQVYKRDSMMAQAIEIGRFEAAGFNWRDYDKVLDKIRAVSAADVQAVAKKYFGPDSDDRLTVAVLDPQPIDESQPKKNPGNAPSHIR
jgi:zinc protease